MAQPDGPSTLEIYPDFMAIGHLRKSSAQPASPARGSLRQTVSGRAAPPPTPRGYQRLWRRQRPHYLSSFSAVHPRPDHPPQNADVNSANYWSPATLPSRFQTASFHLAVLPWSSRKYPWEPTSKPPAHSPPWMYRHRNFRQPTHNHSAPREKLRSIFLYLPQLSPNRQPAPTRITRNSLLQDLQCDDSCTYSNPQ